MDKITGFLPGIVKIPTSVQISRFTTTWQSSGFHNSSKVVENSAHFEGISQQKQTWHPPRCSSGHAYKKVITDGRKPITLGFYSRLFLVPKPMKRWQPVIDLSMLNNLLHVPTFKVETAESIRKSIRKGEWVTSIDLTDAYFHASIHPQSQISEISDQKRGFQFWALPFGVATAPLEFTHCERGKTQARNLRIHQYLDDWLLWSPTKEQCLKIQKI